MLVAGELGQFLSQQVLCVCQREKGGAKGLKGGVGFTQLREGLSLDSEDLVEVVVELLGQQLCHEV